MNVPKFLEEDGGKPQGSYEWTLWALLQVATVVSVIVALPFLIFIAVAMSLIDIFVGSDV